MYASIWLSCPRCSHEVDARAVFTKADLAQFRPGIVTCPHCGARFTYGLKGFRTFAIGMCAGAILCPWLGLLQFDTRNAWFDVALFAIISLWIAGLCGLSFAGRQLVD